MIWPVLALLLSTGASPAPEAPGAAAPYELVCLDGHVLDLEGPPAAKGASLVGRLWPAGTLVSIPAREVDSRRTEERNRAARGGRQATPVEASRTGDSLAEKVGLRASPQEARRVLEQASGTGKGARSEPPEREEVGVLRDRRRRDPPAGRAEKEAWREASLPDEPPLDLRGRGEAYWRDRAERLREAVRDTQAEMERAEVRAERFEREVPIGWTPSEQASWARERIRLRDAADRARSAYERAREDSERLREEARRAGALPGWLR